MWYAIGYLHEALPDGTHDPNGAGWWTRLAGPQTGPNTCAIALGRELVGSTSKAPRSAMVYEAFKLIEEREFPDYGLPFPSAQVVQPPLPGVGE